MKYNIIEFVRNDKDQYSASVTATYDNIEGAKVKYHQRLATLHNAPDVVVATVKIEDEFGHELNGYTEQIEHVTEDAEETEA